MGLLLSSQNSADVLTTLCAVCCTGIKMCPINMVLMSLAAAISSAATLVSLEFCLYYKYMTSLVPLSFRPAGMGGMSLLLGTAASFSGKSALARCVFCCTSAIFVVNATLMKVKV